MKKILFFVLAFLVAISVSACADNNRVGNILTQTGMIGNDATTNVGHTHITTGPAFIYRVTYSSSTANVCVNIYDSASMDTETTTQQSLSALTAGGNKYVKADLPCVAANTVYQVEYDPPMYCQNGILAGFGDTTNGPTLLSTTTASAIIEYASY